MASNPVTIKLVLPYAFRPDELRSIEGAGKTPEQTCRDLSEQFIGRALTAVKGAELDRKEARMFGRVKRELDKGEDSITLDGTLADWFFDLFFSPTSEEKVKVRPEHAVWWGVWLDALEDLRQAARE